MAYLRKFVVALLGGGLLALGAVMVVLPGPGIPVVAAALGLLALEFEFARRWKDKLRERMRSLTRKKQAPE